MSGSTCSAPDRVALPRNSDGVFTEIAGTYDFINKVLSFGQEQNWRRRAIAKLPPGRLLDLGSGTGAALPVLGAFDVVGLDPEAAMLSISPISQKVVGYGERLPFPDGSFDAVFSAYVFRNLTSVDETLTGDCASAATGRESRDRRPQSTQEPMVGPVASTRLGSGSTHDRDPGGKSRLLQLPAPLTGQAGPTRRAVRQWTAAGRRLVADGDLRVCIRSDSR